MKFDINEVWRELVIKNTKGGACNFQEAATELAVIAADAEAKRIHDEGMVTVGHMREQIEEATRRANASWTLMCKKMVQAEIDAHKILYGAASDVLSCIESQYRPPVRDVPECGKMVQIRLHALARLSEVATKSHRHIVTHLVLSEMKEALD